MCNVMLPMSVLLVILAVNWLLVSGDVALFQMLSVVMIMNIVVHQGLLVKQEVDIVCEV